MASNDEVMADMLRKHEAEKMSRRAVLAKFGLRFGVAAIAALSVDDLARKVTEAIAQSNRNNRVAQDVAQQFHNAGIAMAHTDGSLPASCGCTAVGNWCFADGVAGCEQCCRGTISNDGMCKPDPLQRETEVQCCIQMCPKASTTIGTDPGDPTPTSG